MKRVLVHIFPVYVNALLATLNARSSTIQATVLESGREMFQTQLTDIEFSKRNIEPRLQAQEQVASTSYNERILLTT